MNDKFLNDIFNKLKISRDVSKNYTGTNTVLKSYFGGGGSPSSNTKSTSPTSSGGGTSTPTLSNPTPTSSTPSSTTPTSSTSSVKPVTSGLTSSGGQVYYTRPTGEVLKVNVIGSSGSGTKNISYTSGGGGTYYDATAQKELTVKPSGTEESSGDRYLLQNLNSTRPTSQIMTQQSGTVPQTTLMAQKAAAQEMNLQAVKTPISQKDSLFDTNKEIFGTGTKTYEQVKQKQSMKPTSLLDREFPSLLKNYILEKKPISVDLKNIQTPKTLTNTNFLDTKTATEITSMPEKQKNIQQITSDFEIMYTGLKPKEESNFQNITNIQVPITSGGVNNLGELFTKEGLKKGWEGIKDTFKSDKNLDKTAKEITEKTLVEFNKEAGTNIKSTNDIPLATVLIENVIKEKAKKQIDVIQNTKNEIDTTLNKYPLGWVDKSGKEYKTTEDLIMYTPEQIKSLGLEQKHIVPLEEYDKVKSFLIQKEENLKNSRNELDKTIKDFDKFKVNTNNIIQQYQEKMKQTENIDKLDTISNYYAQKANLSNLGNVVPQAIVGGAKMVRDTAQFIGINPVRETLQDVKEGRYLEVGKDIFIPGLAQAKGIYNPDRPGLSQQALSGGINTAFIISSFGIGAAATPTALSAKELIKPTLGQMVSETGKSFAKGAALNVGMSTLLETPDIISGKQSFEQTVGDIAGNVGYFSALGASSKLAGALGSASASKEFSSKAEEALRGAQYKTDNVGREYIEYNGQKIYPKFYEAPKGTKSIGSISERTISYDIPFEYKGKIYTIKTTNTLAETTNVVGNVRGKLQRSPLLTESSKVGDIQILTSEGKPITRVMSAGLVETRGQGFSQPINENKMFAGKEGSVFKREIFEGDWTNALRTQEINGKYPFKDIGIKYTKTPFQSGTQIESLGGDVRGEVSRFKTVSYVGEPSKISKNVFEASIGEKITLPTNLKNIYSNLKNPLRTFGESKIDIISQEGTIAKGKPSISETHKVVKTGEIIYQEPSILFDLTNKYGKPLGPTSNKKYNVDEFVGKKLNENKYIETTPGEEINIIKERGSSPFVSVSKTTISKSEFKEPKVKEPSFFDDISAKTSKMMKSKVAGIGMEPQIKSELSFEKTKYSGETVLPEERLKRRTVTLTETESLSRLPSNMIYPLKMKISLPSKSIAEDLPLLRIKAQGISGSLGLLSGSSVSSFDTIPSLITAPITTTTPDVTVVPKVDTIPITKPDTTTNPDTEMIPNPGPFIPGVSVPGIPGLGIATGLGILAGPWGNFNYGFSDKKMKQLFGTKTILNPIRNLGKEYFTESNKNFYNNKIFNKMISNKNKQKWI